MTPPIQSATAWYRGVVLDGGTAGDMGRKRHRILRELQGELERHPAVQHVTGRPGDKYRELRAVLNPAVLGVEAKKWVCSSGPVSSVNSMRSPEELIQQHFLFAVLL